VVQVGEGGDRIGHDAVTAATVQVDDRGHAAGIVLE
jgi:hypothetical protein